MLNKKCGVFLLASVVLSTSLVFTYDRSIAQTPTPAKKSTVQAPKPAVKPSAATPKPATSQKKPAKPTVAIAKLSPISDSACKGIKGYMMTVLNKKGAEIVLNQAAIEDRPSKIKGTACQLSTSDTAKHFKTLADVTSPLSKVLTQQGWVEDNKYAADGPEGKAIGFRKFNNLILVDVNSSLAKGVSCKKDVPVETCYKKAKPEQILYKITLKAARTVK